MKDAIKMMENNMPAEVVRRAHIKAERILCRSDLPSYVKNRI